MESPALCDISVTYNTSNRHCKENKRVDSKISVFVKNVQLAYLSENNPIRVVNLYSVVVPKNCYNVE